VTREELFITTKVWSAHWEPARTREFIQDSLRDFQLSYIDLVLVHWPCSLDYDLFKQGTFRRNKIPLSTVWGTLEQLVDEGLVRSIGVSNFNIAILHDLLCWSRIKPCMNQVELHP